ncbi:hypothetical protein [Paenibacillus massiliensis]|uniref:hypothetical protein n=1 Tax=Paenibacillus massiliensis TaxID=225917 RepID=UPI00068751F4|nr:hypothetical protein [Paenibacillus massiliensis]
MRKHVQRKTATRKIANNCIYCDKCICKGDVYYHEKIYDLDEDGKLWTWTMNVCPRCRYEHEDRARRKVGLQEHCNHPSKMIETKYSYIPGEAVMQPDHDLCTVCGKISP